MRDKAGERAPCLHACTFDGQRTSSGSAARCVIRSGRVSPGPLGNAPRIKRRAGAAVGQPHSCARREVAPGPLGNAPRIKRRAGCGCRAATQLRPAAPDTCRARSVEYRTRLRCPRENALCAFSRPCARCLPANCRIPAPHIEARGTSPPPRRLSACKEYSWQESGHIPRARRLSARKEYSWQEFGHIPRPRRLSARKGHSRQEAGHTPRARRLSSRTPDLRGAKRRSVPRVQKSVTKE